MLHDIRVDEEKVIANRRVNDKEVLHNYNNNTILYICEC